MRRQIHLLFDIGWFVQESATCTPLCQQKVIFDDSGSTEREMESEGKL